MKEMKLSKVVSILLGIILVIGISVINVAAIPETMSYQGYLTDSTGVAVDVPVNITFRIYGVDIGGTALWTETQSVSVSNGVYSVQLGSVTTLTSLNFDVPYWLGVEVETDGEMDPRQPFDSVPFAVISAMSEFATSAGSASSADFATSVADGSVTDGSITGTISSSKIEHLGLNADLLDDMDSAEFATALHVHGGAEISPQGSGSGLDADFLDGQDSAAFANTSHSHGSADITAPLNLTMDAGGYTIHGINSYALGIGVRGDGGSMGVWGYSGSNDGVGVYGEAGATGANYGVYGFSQSPTGYGVYGKNIVGGYAGYFEGPLLTTDNVIAAGTITASGFTGSGANLTNLNASQITNGTVADSRLSANVDLLDGDQTVTGVKNFDPASGTVPFTVDASKTGPVTNLNADLLDGQQASDIIDAASDEVRTPISACGTTISTSGSYYVTQNLPTALTCITVVADNVTIDLMGFTLTGGGIGTLFYGIYIDGVSNVEVKNGTVTNFFKGIYVRATANVNSNRALNVRAVANSNHGISLSGNGSFVERCTVADNGSYGIYVGKGSTVTNNIAYNNQGHGISGFASTVTNNTVYNNQGHGIFASTGSTVTNNTAYTNQMSGIRALASIVINNTARDNQQWGIFVSQSSSVIENVISANNRANIASLGGLHVDVANYVKGNALSYNYQNNMYVNGSLNVIEENLVTNSTNGINFVGTGNFYANNRASGNTTNYVGTLPTGDGDGGGNVSF